MAVIRITIVLPMGVPRKSMAGLALTALLLPLLSRRATAMVPEFAIPRLVRPVVQEDQRLLPADQPDVKNQASVFRIPPLLLLTLSRKSAIPADKIVAAQDMPAMRPAPVPVLLMAKLVLPTQAAVVVFAGLMQIVIAISA